MGILKNSLGPALTALVLPIIFAGLLSAAKRKARRDGKSLVLEYGREAKILGTLSLCASTLMIFVGLHAPEAQRHSALPICLGMSLFMLFLPLEFFFRRIAFDDSEIVVRCAWHKVRRIPWTDVISFGPVPGRTELVLVSKNHGQVKFSSYLQGIADLKAAAARHIKPAPEPIA